MTPTDSPARELRIGDVARLAGTTPRTIRYYEELGLLPGAVRRAGQHRLYDEGAVERLQELLRLKDLLGLTLEELRTLMAAEEARAVLREEFQHTGNSKRRREILREALVHIGRQLELVELRREEIMRLASELTARRARITARLQELEQKMAKDR